MCAGSSTHTKMATTTKIPRNTLLTEDLPHRRTPYSPWTCPTADHPTHRGPAPPQNTLLIVDLPHRGIPNSPWTLPTAEHPTHCGPAPQWKTLLTKDLPHRGTPYSPWTWPTAKHPTHLGPAYIEHPKHWNNMHLMAWQHTTHRLNWPRGRCCENTAFIPQLIYESVTIFLNSEPPREKIWLA